MLATLFSTLFPHGGGFVAAFFSGVLLCNSVPHLTSGLQGRPFPTPFAKPRGIGDSSPLVNVLWGFANLVAALVLLSRRPVELSMNPALCMLLAGVLTIAIFSARHFGKVYKDKLQQKD